MKYCRTVFLLFLLPFLCVILTSPFLRSMFFLSAWEQLQDMETFRNGNVLPIRVQIPGGWNTLEDDWFPLVSTFRADELFQEWSGEEGIELTILYNFPSFSTASNQDSGGCCSHLFDPASGYYNSFYGAYIVRRADGLFSYQLVVVVDDLDMGVDDIVRGRDLLRSNALQIAIRRALIKAGFRKAKTQASAPSQHAPQSQYTPYNPENPRYAHLPLIDNAAGRRLAKRERSLDMGALRAHGVTAEQVVGYCAWLLGLQGDSAHTSPQPMSAVEALQEFDWGKVRADTADRSISQDDFDAYFGL